MKVILKKGMIGILSLFIIIVFFASLGGKQTQSNNSTADLKVIFEKNVFLYGVTRSDIEQGYFYWDRTKLVVIADDNHDAVWKVTAKVTLLDWPDKADKPGSDALEVRSNDTGEWISGGGIVQTSISTGDAITVDVRLNLAGLMNASLGDYVFQINYTLD